jgi:hypothetical protein
VFTLRLCFFPCTGFNIFALFSVLVDNLPWGGSNLVRSLWCPGSFLYLNGKIFLEIWEIFCYCFIEYIKYLFGLHIFSFFNAHDSQVWSFDGVTEVLYIPFPALSLFD